MTGRLSGPELDRLLEHTSALMEKRWLLPAELYIKLDTFRADLRAEQEDRAARRILTGGHQSACAPAGEPAH
ncbi:MAG TPA: hypothetical protein VGM53_15745 [Streptosporangiaceae bacterium]